MRLFEPHKKCGTATILMLRQVITVSLGCARSLDPGVVKRAASLDRGKEWRLVVQASGTNTDAHAVCHKK